MFIRKENTLKKIIAITVLLTLLLSVLTISTYATPASDAGIRVVQQTEDGDIVTFAVQMKLPENSQGITSIASILSYDSTTLELMHATDSTTYTEQGLTEGVNPAVAVNITDSDNTVYMVLDAATYASSNSTALMVNMFAMGEMPNEVQNTTEWQNVYTLRFKLKSGATLTENSIVFANTTDNTNLTGLSDSGRNTDWAVTFDVQNGGVGYCHNPLNGQSTGSVNTMAAAENGTTQIFSQEELMRGDVNGSGKVDPTDALMAMNYYIDKTKYPLSQQQVKAADIDNSGTIEPTDALRIMNYYINKTKYPFPD